MKHVLLLLILSCFFFAACHKAQQQPAKYVPGQVLIGVKANTPIESVFALADSAGLHLFSVEFYDYISTYPADSFASVSYILKNTKPYIDSEAAFVKLSSGVITVDCTFWNMDIPSQTDWINTERQLGLIDKTVGSALVCVTVPAGTEQAAISKVQNNPIVSFASLNYEGQL